MLNNFDRVLALLNCCRVLLFFKSSLLYIEVWKWTLSCQRIQKESFEALINHQWFIAWYVYFPMKEKFQMHSMYEGTPLQAELLSLSCSRDKLCVVEIVVVHFVQFVLCQRLTKKQAANTFEFLSVSRCYSYPFFRNVNTTFNPLNKFWIFKFAYPYELATSDIQLLINLLLMNLLLITSSLLKRYVFRSTSNFSSSSSSDAFKLPFVQFFALFCSFRTSKWSRKFCLWSCTLEQILAYPINQKGNVTLERLNL